MKKADDMSIWEVLQVYIAEIRWQIKKILKNKQ